MKRFSWFPCSRSSSAPDPSWAQDVPRGRSFRRILTHAHLGNRNSFKTTPLGWQAAVTGNVNKMFGITGDISGEYKSVSGLPNKLKIYTFMGGPPDYAPCG